MSLVIEVQQFSGRTNPRFVLSPDDEAEVHRLVSRRAPPARMPSGPSPAPARLGHRQYVVYRSSPVGSWHPWLTVSDGTAVDVTGPDAGRRRPVADLEALLVAAATRAAIEPPPADEAKE